jgi:hypothetical protein
VERNFTVEVTAPHQVEEEEEEDEEGGEMGPDREWDESVRGSVGVGVDALLVLVGEGRGGVWGGGRGGGGGGALGWWMARVEVMIVMSEVEERDRMGDWDVIDEDGVCVDMVRGEGGGDGMKRASEGGGGKRSEGGRRKREEAVNDA